MATLLLHPCIIQLASHVTADWGQDLQLKVHTKHQNVETISWDLHTHTYTHQIDLSSQEGYSDYTNHSVQPR